MRRLVLILPDLLVEGEDPSPLRQNLPALTRMAEEGSVLKITQPPVAETPEAFWLGMGPNEGQMRQGPLTVSALGADPPERSIHFHLSLMSFLDGIAHEVPGKIPDDDLATILDLAPHLNTKTLTLVSGIQADHGLVWEDLGELFTLPARDLDGKPIAGSLPNGDGDVRLRRYIDDSINLLTEQEFNVIRFEAGLPMLNLLWPWGNGTREPVPNLLLKRGERAVVLSSSLRLSGLARLAGYRHGEYALVGNAMNAKLEEIGKRVREASGPVIVVMDPITRLRELERIEELHWLISEIDRRLLTPLIEDSELNPTRITIVAGPLALTWDSKIHVPNGVPFDERALEERRLGDAQIWELVERVISLKSVSSG